MRIRKQAKLAGLALTATTATDAAAGSSDLTSLMSSSGRRFQYSPHICQLNQSPWDVISFPPDSASSTFQVDGEDRVTANGSSEDSLRAVESVASLRLSTDGEDKKANNNCGVELGFGKDGDILCCTTNGKSWHCKNDVSGGGHSLCEHHLAQLKFYNGLAHPSEAAVGKKSEKPAVAAVEKTAGIRRRGRPRKPPAAAAAATANPHEFYYYSGFGPRWGKKRGVLRSHEAESVDKVVVKEKIPPSSSSSSQIDSEEFDYIEEEDDDDDGNADEISGGFGKKRGRKWIKARSLKSLM